MPIIIADKSIVEPTITAQGSMTFRKQILKRGRFLRPNQTKRYINFDQRFFDEVMRAFNEGALTRVPVLLGTHDEEKTERSIGLVRSLETDTNGLYAIVEITDENTVKQIQSKTRDGQRTIDEVSVSIASVVTDEGTKYPLALTHLAVVTHGWYRDMESFEQIAASLEGGDSHYFSLNDEYIQPSKEKKVTPEEILALLKEQGIDTDNEDAVKAAIEKMKGDPTPPEPVQVTAEAVVAALKEGGIEVDSIDDLKATMDTAKQNNAVITALSGIFSPPDPDDDPNNIDISGLVASVTTLSNGYGELQKENAEIKAAQLNTTAETEVGKLIQAGKVTPAQKESFVTLYKENKTVYDTLTANLEVVVPLGQNGEGSGDADNTGADLDVDKEVERLSASSQMTTIVKEGE